MLYRCGGIFRKAKNVAAKSDDTGSSPCLQHPPILADLVLSLLGVQQIARIDRLQPDEDPHTSGTPAFFDEVREASASTWIRKVKGMFSCSRSAMTRSRIDSQ